MDCSTPGLPVLHHLPGIAQTHVHQVGIISSSVVPFSSSFNLSLHQGLLQSQLSTSGAKVPSWMCSLPYGDFHWFSEAIRTSKWSWAEESRHPLHALCRSRRETRECRAGAGPLALVPSFSVKTSSPVWERDSCRSSGPLICAGPPPRRKRTHPFLPAPSPTRGKHPQTALSPLPLRPTHTREIGLLSGLD